MRLRQLVARGFRNLVDLDREIPSQGVVLLGANAQGITNLLEAIYYPVLAAVASHRERAHARVAIQWLNHGIASGSEPAPSAAEGGPRNDS